MAKKESKKANKIKIELSSFSIFLWSLFIFFLLAWVFFLGVLAGRGMLPEEISELENPFKKLKDTVTQKGEYEYKKPEKDPAFAFYDNLESKKSEVKKENIPPKEKDPPREITLSRDETTDTAAGQKPLEKDREKPEVPLPAAAPQDFFSVQIASVSNPDSAKKVVKELVNQDYDAYYYSATVNGKGIYRIMCGKFSIRSNAVEYLNRLKKDTRYKKGFIVKVNVEK
jgi:cell division septation protein DedD